MLLRGSLIAILLVAITPLIASFPLALSERHAPRKADTPAKMAVRAIKGPWRRLLVYAPFISAAKIRNGFFMCIKARMFNASQSSLEALAMMSRSNLYGHSVFHHIGIKRVPQGCDLALGEPTKVDRWCP